MSNLLSTGISGLSAAQVALNTVGNNISNTNTDGYSRQTVQQTQRLTQSSGRYTIGSGVDVVSVQRAYSQYLTSAVWNSNASLQRASTFNDLTSTLNSVFSGSGDLQGALDTFYGAFSTVANAASSTSGRQALLGNASSLAAVFNTLGQQLGQQQSQINQQIGSTVDSINSVIGNIADLNKQIRQSSATGQPNALLDQRDALVKTLSGYVGISAVAESDGTMSVYTTNGQSLVSGSNAYPLSTSGEAYDVTRTDILDSSGNNITTRLSGGSLGALLDYRTNVLDPAQNQLGQAALALASSVNAQQAKGLDLNGKQGAAIFSMPSPGVFGSSANQGSADVTAKIDDVSQLTASDYVLSYDGSQWNLRTTAGQNVALATNADGSLSADGLTFNVSGTAQAGDSYQIQPTRNAAAGLAVSMTDPSGIAAAAALTGTAAGGNTGTGAIGAIGVADTENAGLLGTATVTFSAPDTYQVTDASGNVLASGSYTSGQPITANGWSLTLSGAPAAGDSFEVAANTNGLNDNSNALALAGLANTGVLGGGATSVLGAYANLTTQIGSVGSQAATTLTTQTSLYSQAVSAQQSVSGVNLDEEAANLVKYQQAYQASAQIISTAQSIFTSLLSAIQG
ncbi:flagellar hook-associated protein FlgK [Rhodanobacter sp. Col0626]|uniref:flagellar hook-associated protein FlgK n=1 Tax=Rhodanobacter sp. Col0626 TaxID=3415679 RepID=UPI003CEFF333